MTKTNKHRVRGSYATISRDKSITCHICQSTISRARNLVSHFSIKHPCELLEAKRKTKKYAFYLIEAAADAKRKQSACNRNISDFFSDSGKKMSSGRSQSALATLAKDVLTIETDADDLPIPPEVTSDKGCNIETIVSEGEEVDQDVGRSDSRSIRDSGFQTGVNSVRVGDSDHETPESGRQASSDQDIAATCHARDTPPPRE